MSEKEFPYVSRDESGCPSDSGGEDSGSRAGKSTALKDIRVLFADDDSVSRKIVAGVLRKSGCVVETVCGGREAVDILSKKKYDIVLMDINMPLMDGMSVTKIIRDPGSAVLDHDVPVVAYTSCAEKQTRQMCSEAGMNGYITKPVFPDQLREEIIRHLLKANEIRQQSGPRGEPGE